MQVDQYLYQSPSPNAVQMGRLDPSSQKSDPAESSTDSSSESKNQNDISQNPVAQTTQKEQPTISDKKIDIYA